MKIMAIFKSTSFKIYSENFPFFCRKSSFCISCKSNACFRVSGVLKIVVADWKLCIALFNVTLINNANIAAPKDWSLLWVASNCKLS